MRPPRLACFAVFIGAVGLLRPASFTERVEALFRPPLGEMITLSPDGERVAYVTCASGQLAIVIMNVEPPGPKRTVRLDPVGRDTSAAGQQLLELRFLRWASNTRLVYAPPERIVPLPPVPDKTGRLMPNPDGPTIIAPIFAMDADGKQRGVVVDARQFQETPAEARRSLADLLRTTKELQATRNEPVRWRMPHLDILGFLPRDRDQLVVQTHGAYSIPMQHLVDLRTGGIREFGGDWPALPGEPHVFDGYRLRIVGEHRVAAQPSTTWRDEELARVQRELQAKFSRRVVELLDWSDTRARVLARVTGGSDAGRLFIYQRPEDLVVEILRRAPWLPAAKLHETRFFQFAAPDGAPLSGYLTWPARPRGTPPPLLVVFPDGFPGHAQTAFDPEAQVLADFGFVVARLNHRSVAGIRPADLNALRGAIDRVSVNDAHATLEWIAARHPERPFDRKRVAVFGRGFGGYLALRALQLEPGVFRCGVAIDAPMDLRAWLQSGPAAGVIPAGLLEHEEGDRKKLSVLDHADALTNPLVLLVEPWRNAAIDAASGELIGRSQRLGRPIDYFALDAGFASGQPASRAAAYRKIEEFLNLHLYGYAVKVGPAKEVE